MYHLSETFVGLTIIAAVAGFTFTSQAHMAKKEAVLGEISVIMNDLETELKKTELPNGTIPEGIDIEALFQKAKNTALVGKAGDVDLMPDITEQGHQAWLGGCPVQPSSFIALRMDHTALTEIPHYWKQSAFKICLDRNGALGPNAEGYDVIWLSFSRTNSPHITLIPAHTSLNIQTD